ncbi:olfactory receptor 11A1-like [Balaenoptera acutorostrata]|uniref:Olfactory receptor 11A1-like n=1 Tax=Balaenoptera acutorostrata TaxID=9767 RepID=A0ABM3SV06_BALAC|nr:olfactory receptor 11A1-like [Balaenoptera acutorostrata]
MVTEFIILGFGDLKELGPLLFLVFGAVYLATIFGNLLLVILVSTQQGLQTPMYFFLANLSYLEVCYTSNIMPRLRQNRVISMWQLHSRLLSSLTFYGGNEIDHFFCDLKRLQKLSCSYPQLVNLICMSLTALVTLAPFGLILASYWKILVTVLHIPFMIGRQKAFSTCSSHLVVVTLFYGTLMLVYALPLAGQVPILNKIFSLLYTVVTPMCNRLIYSLKNKDVEEALRKLRVCSYNDELHSINQNDGSLKVKALSPSSGNSQSD